MHTPEAVCAMYALNWIGAVANMVYPTLSGQELIHILEETGSKLFFVLDAVLEKVEAVRSEIAARIIVLSVSDSMPALLKIGYHLKAGRRKQKDLTWREFLAKTAGSSPQAADSAAPAVMVYTSGTTGVSKGVVLNSDCVNSVVFQCIQAGKNYQRKETFLDNIPVFFGFGISMLHLGLAINNVHLMVYKADGIIVSSPTGSTAYSLSAGGPIMSPRIPALLLTPICAHTFNMRPLVIGEDDVVHIKIAAVHQDILVTFDGQESFRLLPGDEVMVRKSKIQASIVKFQDKDYYQILRTKLWKES